MEGKGIHRWRVGYTLIGKDEDIRRLVKGEGIHKWRVGYTLLGRGEDIHGRWWLKVYIGSG